MSGADSNFGRPALGSKAAGAKRATSASISPSARCSEAATRLSANSSHSTATDQTSVMPM
jgi:hypothetical protein